jgi:L-arabinokinase
VAADIPAAAFAAARQAGVFSVGISNFTWDWIYQGLAATHPGYADVLESLADDYRQADRLLRLPFHGNESVIRYVEDQALVARTSALTKAEIRRRLNLSTETQVGLISFGGFGLKAFDPAPLGRLAGWVFLTDNCLPGAPENLRPIPAAQFAYPDLVKAADVVITKPGYGIVSECLANGTACLYTERGDFREQALLVEGLHRYGNAQHISNAELRSGDWHDALATLLQQPPPSETLLTNGDTVIADRLAQLIRTIAGDNT